MKSIKKIIAVICAVLYVFTLSGCDLKRRLHRNRGDSSSCIINPCQEEWDFLVSELEKKYDKKFEVLGGGAPLMSVFQTCDVRCIDDGIEFKARLHDKDYLEVESENYLCYKYLDDITQEVKQYTNKYIKDYKLVVSGTSFDLPFNTKADLSYDEYKKYLKENDIFIPYYYCILIPEDKQFTDDEWKVLIDKFASDRGYIEDYVDDDYKIDTFREDIGLDIDFPIFKTPKERYDLADKIMSSYEYESKHIDYDGIRIM